MKIDSGELEGVEMRRWIGTWGRKGAIKNGRSFGGEGKRRGGEGGGESGGLLITIYVDTKMKIVCIHRLKAVTADHAGQVPST